MIYTVKLNKRIKEKKNYAVYCGHLLTSLVDGQTSRMYSINPGQYMYSVCI
jgi:hypothetical protein